MLVPESIVSDIPLAETEKGSLLVGGYIDARVSHAAIFTPAQLLQRNATARPQPATRNPHRPLPLRSRGAGDTRTTGVRSSLSEYSECKCDSHSPYYCRL